MKPVRVTGVRTIPSLLHETDWKYQSVYRRKILPKWSHNIIHKYSYCGDTVMCKPLGLIALMVVLAYFKAKDIYRDVDVPRTGWRLYQSPKWDNPYENEPAQFDLSIADIRYGCLNEHPEAW